MGDFGGDLLEFAYSSVENILNFNSIEVDFLMCDGEGLSYLLRLLSPAPPLKPPGIVYSYVFIPMISFSRFSIL